MQILCYANLLKHVNKDECLIVFLLQLVYFFFSPESREAVYATATIQEDPNYPPPEAYARCFGLPYQVKLVILFFLSFKTKNLVSSHCLLRKILKHNIFYPINFSSIR